MTGPLRAGETIWAQQEVARWQAEEAARPFQYRGNELERVQAVKASGFVPEQVGSEIPEAPARGPIRMFDMIKAYPKGEGDFEFKRSGHMGRKCLQRADSFDVMTAKAAGRSKPAPFSPAQVAMGRFYRDLVEKYQSAGVKCSSVEGVSGGGAGSSGAFIDAVLRDRERIAVLRERIGSSAAMEVKRGKARHKLARVTIMDRRLVDIVCLEDGTMTDVLRAHGWANDAKLRVSLQKALADVLDRMMGPVQRGGASVAHFGAGCVPVFEGIAAG